MESESGTIIVAILSTLILSMTLWIIRTLTRM